MQEAHGAGDLHGAEPPEARRVVFGGRIESKLGLEPSDHRSTRPKEDDATPAKRARLRRHSPRLSP